MILDFNCSSSDAAFAVYQRQLQVMGRGDLAATWVPSTSMWVDLNLQTWCQSG
jgi:hypothetical protein